MLSGGRMEKGNIAVKGAETKRAFRFADLSDGLAYDILAKVPPKDVYKNGRLVCRAWRDIISRDDFVAQNFIETKTQEQLLIARCRKHYYQGKLMEIEKIIKSPLEQHYECKVFDVGLSRMGFIRASCNGLILVNHPSQKGSLQLMNMITMVATTLPNCPSGCPHSDCGSALGFDPKTKEFKVVHVYSDSFGFEIFTLGSPDGTWRRIPGPWTQDLLLRPFNLEQFHWTDPISVDGQVLHWHLGSNKCIASMNVSEEIPLETNLPNIGGVIQLERYNLTVMGGHLSLVYNVSDSQTDVWILEDLRGQSWSKKHSIQLELTNMPDKCLPSSKYTNVLPNLCKLEAVASVREGGKLIFRHTHSLCLYAYDMRHRVMKKLKANLKSADIVIPHRSGLLHWRKLHETRSVNTL